MKIVCVSGYFNPLRSEHLAYLREAKKLGDCLIVILNNDKQLKITKNKQFMNIKERYDILSELRCIDAIFISIDKDKTVSKSLEKIRPHIFAIKENISLKDIPEYDVCKKMGIEIKTGIGSKK